MTGLSWHCDGKKSVIVGKLECTQNPTLERIKRRMVIVVTVQTVRVMVAIAMILLIGSGYYYDLKEKVVRSVR